MTEINDKGSIANFMTNGNIESFLKEKEEQLKGITPFPWRLECESGEGQVNALDAYGIHSFAWYNDQQMKDGTFISQSPELISQLIKMVRIYREVACKDRDTVLQFRNPFGGYFPTWTEDGIRLAVDEEVKRIMEKG